MNKNILFLIAFALAASSAGASSALTSAKVTQVQNDVRLKDGKVVSAGNSDLDPAPPRGKASERNARVGDVVGGTRTLKTGKESRAELLFNDNTVARLGANSTFSFKPGSRDIDLKSGFLLLHTPKGKGGAKISTPAAAASVLGTTIMLSALPDGGMKLVVLEGTASINYKGVLQKVEAGQLVFLTQENGISPAITIDLQKLVQSSGMMKDFSSKIGSEGLIQEAIKDQAEKIEDGELEANGFTIGGDQNGLYSVNAAAIEALTRDLEIVVQALAQSTAQIDEDFGGAFTISPSGSIDFGKPEAGDGTGNFIFGFGQGEIVFSGDRFRIVDGAPFEINQQDVTLVTFLASGQSVNYITSFNAIRADNFHGSFGGDLNYDLVFRAQRGNIGIFNSDINQGGQVIFHAQGQGLKAGNVELFNSTIKTSGEKISLSSAGAGILIDQSQLLLNSAAGSQVQMSALRDIAIQNSLINTALGDRPGGVLIAAGQNSGRVDINNSVINAVQGVHASPVRITGSEISIMNSSIFGSVVSLGNSSNEAVVSFFNTVIGTSSGQVIVNNTPITQAEGLTIQTLP